MGDASSAKERTLPALCKGKRKRVRDRERELEILQGKGRTIEKREEESE